MPHCGHDFTVLDALVEVAVGVLPNQVVPCSAVGDSQARPRKCNDISGLQLAVASQLLEPRLATSQCSMDRSLEKKRAMAGLRSAGLDLFPLLPLVTLSYP